MEIAVPAGESEIVNDTGGTPASLAAAAGFAPML